MIDSGKTFADLDAANSWGNFIAANTGWKYKGAKVVSSLQSGILLTPYWEY